MFDSFFNYIIFLIPLAIFIGRIVVQARSKREAPQNIPIHFEDEEEEKPPVKKAPTVEQKSRGGDEFYPYALSQGAPEYLKGLPGMPRAQAPVPPRVPKSQLVNPQGQAAFMAVPEQRGFPLNLNNLSPLKQAVVMAEVLGPPKGLV